jgi:hypothetical protein
MFAAVLRAILVGIIVFLFPILIGIGLFFIVIKRLREKFSNEDDES